MLYQDSLEMKVIPSPAGFTQFEHTECVISCRDSCIRLCVIYRPPPSTQNGLKTTTFFDEWTAYLDHLAITPQRIIITGDFNLHMDNLQNPDTTRFTSLLPSHGLSQHVHSPTHHKGHTLDLVITRDTEAVLSQHPTVFDPGLFDHHGDCSGDHFALSFCANVSKPRACCKQVSFRKLKDICVAAFTRDITECPGLQDTSQPLECLVQAYSENLSSLIDKHAPLQTKEIVLRPHAPWYSEELREAKHERRRRERKWHSTKLAIHHQLFRDQCRTVAKLVQRTRRAYYCDQISQCGRDQKHLFRLTNKLLGKSGAVTLPSHDSSQDLAQRFSQFFQSKINTIRETISNEASGSTPAEETPFSGTPLSGFQPVTEAEVRKALSSMPCKSCE